MIEPTEGSVEPTSHADASRCIAIVPQNLYLAPDPERRVSERLTRAARQCTAATIAHRLATIRTADVVVLLSEGRIVGTGSFDQLVAEHPEFALAATLQGLLGSDSGLSGADASVGAVDQPLRR